MSIITILNVGTFKVIDNELHFLDCFTKEWETFNKEYIDFIFTKEEWLKVVKRLGNFKAYGG